MPVSDQAICIGMVDYSETSQVLHLLTRAGGVVRLLAKGSKRPRSRSGGRIDLFWEGRCVFAGSRPGSLGTLMESAETTCHAGLRGDLRRLNAAIYMLELVGAMLAEGDPAPEAFDLLSRALARLDEAGAPVPAVLAYFQWRLIRHAGLLGQLQACASCGGKIGARGVCFSSSLGGFLCRSCQAGSGDRRPVPPSALAGIAALSAAESGKRPRLPDKQAHAVNALLAYHIEYQLGRRLKTARGAIEFPGHSAGQHTPST